MMTIGPDPIDAPRRCNLCDGTAFGPGPGGRMSQENLAPHCLGCGSLERHRAAASALDIYPSACFDGQRALLIGAQQDVAPARLAHCERIQAPQGGKVIIPDEAGLRGAYGFIGLVYVLEYLDDDRTDFKRLMRLVAPAGMLQVCFIGAEQRPWTSIQAGPRGSLRRLYGRDVQQHFCGRERLFSMTPRLQADPVTGTLHPVHFFRHAPGALS